MLDQTTASLSTPASLSRSQRYVAIALAAWAMLWVAAMYVPGGFAWHFFAEGSRILTNQTAIHPIDLYAQDPKLQIGPFTFLVSILLEGFRAPWEDPNTAGSFAAQIFGCLLGIVIVFVVHSLIQSSNTAPGRAERERPWLFPLAVAAFIPAWAYVAVFSVHLDDVLALTLGVCAVWAMTRDRGVLAGVCIGLAVASKPWALPFIAVGFIAPSSLARLRVAVAAGGVTAAAWLPFIIGSPGTAAAMHFQIPNTAWSGLRALGFIDPLTPWWDRPLQILLGLAIASILVIRGRWPWAILVIMSVRLALDPGTNRYYTAGLLVGALLVDTLATRSRIPWFSITAVVGLHLARFVPALNFLHGYLLVAYAVVVVAAAFVLPAPTLGGRLARRANIEGDQFDRAGRLENTTWNSKTSSPGLPAE